MGNPSDKTIETYRQNFDKYVERTSAEPSGEFKEWMDSFASHIPKDGVILEIGSASGRDARYFVAKGFKVVCTDVIPEALQKLSDEGFETAEFDFRSEMKTEWAGKFDGFFANAVLLHAPQDVFKNALKNITTVLKENGVVAFSLKIGRGEEITLEKMDAPRYFLYHTEEEIREILSKLPFDIISLTHADNEKWLHVIVKLKVEKI
jgi:SAM-dependent methyltransferase